MSDLAAAERLAATQNAFRVLIVDDDQDMVAFFGRLLAKEAMSVDAVYDGAAALAHIAATPPDLVLLDVMMPGMSGFEVCERLKADPVTALIPVVLVTALEDHGSRVRGIEAGADDFLSKPVNREELIARVKTLRRLHQTRRELEGRRLAAEVRRKDAIRRTFSRYLSPRLAEQIIDDLGDDAVKFTVDARRAAVVALFADLRGFTRITESIEVASVVGMLNEYFSVLTEVAYENDGTIFNMAGDSLLVGFNVPFDQVDASARAWRTAEAMVSRFAPIAEDWMRRHKVSAGIGIGMCRGEAIIGNVGSPHFMSYTVIGDTVNTAARLMQMAKASELLLSGAAYQAIRDLVPAARVESRGEVALRGKSGATPVYSIRL
jgi:class 3 adenylate cyclase